MRFRKPSGLAFGSFNGDRIAEGAFIAGAIRSEYAIKMAPPRPNRRVTERRCRQQLAGQPFTRRIRLLTAVYRITSQVRLGVDRPCKVDISRLLRGCGHEDGYNRLRYSRREHVFRSYDDGIGTRRFDRVRTGWHHTADVINVSAAKLESGIAILCRGRNLASSRLARAAATASDISSAR